MIAGQLELARSFARARLEPLRLLGRSEGALAAWQEARVRRFLAWAAPRSRELAERLDGRPIEAWRSMPIIDKRRMMARWDDVVTVPVGRDEALEVALRAEQDRDFAPTVRGYTVGLSSGTSGNRGLFVASPRERFEWAGAAIARVLPDAIPGVRAHRVAFFMRASSNLYETVGSRRIQFRFYDLQQPFEALAAGLAQQRPTILIAPPSALRLLAQRVEAGALAIAPEIVVSVAEVLEPLDEGRIRRAFRRTVHQVYQATEGFLGSTCRFGTLHLAEDVVCFEREVLDEEGRFHPILTDFRRRSQPIVRYRLDDVLVPRRSPCPCGSRFTAIDRIEGRADDLFWIRGVDGRLAPLFPDFVRRALMLASPSIEDYRVRQLSPDRLALFVRAPDPALRELARAALVELFTSRGAAAPHIEDAPAPAYEPLRKLRRVERAFDAPRGEVA